MACATGLFVVFLECIVARIHPARFLNWNSSLVRLAATCAVAIAGMAWTSESILAQNGSGGGSNGRRLIDVRPSEDGKSQQITLRSRQDSGFGLVELINPRTKAVERVIHAGPVRDGMSISYRPDEALKAGTYAIRFRDGLDLVVDKPILRPDTADGKWVNPTAVTVQRNGLFVVDAGLHTPDLVLTENDEIEWVNPDGKPVKGVYVSSDETSVTVTPSENKSITVAFELAKQSAAAQALVKKQKARQVEHEQLKTTRLPHIMKLNLDGSKVTNWGMNGIYGPVPIAPATLRTFAVDDRGVGYLPSGGHHVNVLGPLGMPEKLTIGGWDNVPAGPVCTVWVSSLAVAGPKKIYIPNAGYGNMKVYDRTKQGFEGILFAVAPVREPRMPNAIAADSRGNYYIADTTNVLSKYHDDDKTLTFKYHSDPELKMAWPTGVSTSAGLVLVACRGPGFGPYWDSGGGGEIVLFWDNGTELVRVARFGVPGFSLDRMELLNPSGTAISADHSSIYVAEDGMTTIVDGAEAPAGNARVTQFKLQHAVEDSVTVELNPSR
jgi:hypothetical protein